jgi:hypothetical protein
VLVTLSAVATGRYTHRQRIIRAERAKILGHWDLDVRNKEISVFMNSFQLSETDFSVGVPDGDIGTIDFHRLLGRRSKGIYRFVGDVLHVAQNGDGKPRPTTFDADQVDFYWEGKRVKTARNSSQTATTKP